MQKKTLLKTIPLVVALACASGWATAQNLNGATPAATTSTAKKLSFGDRHFIENAAKDGIYEVQAGQLAQQKATDPAVKQFAGRIVQDHSKANDELNQLAQAKGVELPAKDTLMDRYEMHKLNKLSGTDFDREFAKSSVKDHKKDIKDFEKAAAKVKDPDVKAWAEKQLPTLREHLAAAHKLPGANS